MNYEKIKIVVLEELNKVIKSFHQNPYDYLYETDIQGEIYYRLKDALSMTRLEPIEREDSDKLAISIVHTEYPTLQRFDVVVLNATPKTKALNHWNNEVIVAIEIKLQQDTDINRSYDIVGDYDKIFKYFASKDQNQFIGIPISFMHTNKFFSETRASLNKFVEATECDKLLLKDGMNSLIIVGNTKKIYSFSLQTN